MLCFVRPALAREASRITKQVDLDLGGQCQACYVCEILFLGASVPGQRRFKFRWAIAAIACSVAETTFRYPGSQHLTSHYVGAMALDKRCDHKTYSPDPRSGSPSQWPSTARLQPTAALADGETAFLIWPSPLFHAGVHGSADRGASPSGDQEALFSPPRA